MAGRLPAEGAGDVVLKEVRDIGLKRPPRTVEKIRACWQRRHRRERQRGEYRHAAAKVPTCCGQCHLQLPDANAGTSGAIVTDVGPPGLPYPTLPYRAAFTSDQPIGWAKADQLQHRSAFRTNAGGYNLKTGRDRR